MFTKRFFAGMMAAVLLTVALPAPIAAAEPLPGGDIAYENNTFIGVSPLGTTINLFDYWLTGQTERDDEVSDGFENQGINNGHALLFGKGMDHEQYRHGLWNTWTGSEDPSPRKGIVANELGYDGYPVLNQGVPGTDYMQGRQGGESLAYLFDPDRLHNGKAVYKDVQGLLSINEDDYYAYDSTKNYAVYYQTSSHGDSNNFRLYDRPGVLAGGSSPDGQFFPFNAVQTDSRGFFEGTEYYNSDLRSDNALINHYFGLHMSTRFVQQNGGYTDDDDPEKTPITYEFSGDDDVWVFIDGVLVADLGGIHDMASLSINFATGVITINGTPKKQKLGEILGYHDDTLPDETYHTLDFFYLERGNVDSNMSLKYNLVYVPESNIYKIDQDGKPLPDRDFELYEAVPRGDGSYDAGDVLAEGTTDAEGRIILLDEKNDLLTIQKLIDKLKPEDLTNETTALILRETSSPPGYRSSGDLELYFYQSQPDSPPFLLSKNHWQTGAHAVARLTATTEENIEYAGRTAEFDPEDHLMFAVVFKRVGEEWLPISGSPATGWTVVAESDLWNGIKKANTYPFVLSSSGSYTALIDELPGDVKKYVEAVGGAEGSYRIVYYFSNQNNPQAINGENTYEITSPMNRVAAVNLYVPNIRNDLTVQKTDQDGELITEPATFALYSEGDITINADGTWSEIPGGQRKPFGTVLTSNGEATFTVIPNGTYYLVETEAPEGYTANPAAVKVIVNDTGVYADAGTQGDGITVARGVGRLVNSMAQFASKNTVDTTLNQIVAKFYTAASDTDIDNANFEWRTITGEGTVAAAFEPAAGVTYHPAYYVQNNDQTGDIDYADDSCDPKRDWHIWEDGIALPIQARGMHLYHKGDHSEEKCDRLYVPISVAGGGEGITEQETDAGWSALLVEQCGSHTRDANTPHTDLTGASLTDLTALFTGKVTVKVKNDPAPGDLTVSKTVTAEPGQSGDTNKLWNFTVTLTQQDGTPLAGRTFNYEGGSSDQTVEAPLKGTLTLDSNGKATFKLKHGQSITIKDIPINVKYKVEEKEAGQNGYETTVEGNSEGSIVPDVPSSVAFTNHIPQTGGLTVSKTVSGADGDQTKDWNFTVKLGDTNVNGKYGDMTFANGEATFTLKHNQSVTAEGLPAGISYKVTEAEADLEGYSTTSTGDEGTILQNETATAAFTNAKTLPRGNLTVSKTVSGADGDQTKDWNFTVTLNDKSVNGEYGGMTFKDGKATFTLKHNQSVTAEDLPAGIFYSVVETEANRDGYVTTSAGAMGRIEADKTGKAVFTNELMAAPPPTGDTARPGWWLALLVLSGAGLAAVCALARKRHAR